MEITQLTQILSISIIVLVAIIVIAWKIYKKGLRKVAIDLIVEVEEKLNDNEEILLKTLIEAKDDVFFQYESNSPTSIACDTELGLYICFPSIR